MKMGAGDGGREGGVAQKEKQASNLYSCRASRHRIPPIQYLCEDLIPEGCTLLAGKPKSGGKSWAALDLGLAVAGGGTFLGKQCVQGDVFYLAFEDNQRRIKSRLKQIGCETWPEFLNSPGYSAPKGE